MAAETVLSMFHPKCSKSVTLSENRRDALVDDINLYSFAYSSVFIPNGLEFSFSYNFGAEPRNTVSAISTASAVDM